MCFEHRWSNVLAVTLMDIKVYCLNVVHVIIVQFICECRLQIINWFRVQRSLYEYISKE